MKRTYGKLFNMLVRWTNTEWLRDLTWYDISSIHHIFIFNKAKAIHEFDLLDSTGAMGREMILDLLFGDWKLAR